jgi:hypothetical protein
MKPKKDKKATLEQREKEAEETLASVRDPNVFAMPKTQTTVNAVVAGGSKTTVPEVPRSTIQNKVDGATPMTPRHTPQTQTSNKIQRAPTQMATQKLEKGKKVLTKQEQEQEQKAEVDEIEASFAARELAIAFAALNIPGWQPYKKIPRVRTVVTGKRASIGSMPMTSEFAFRTRPLPELEVVAIPSSFNIGPSKMQRRGKGVAFAKSEQAALTSTVPPKRTPGRQSCIGSVPSTAHAPFQGSTGNTNRRPSNSSSSTAPKPAVLGTTYSARVEQLNSSSHELRDILLVLPSSVCIRPPRSRASPSSLALKDNALPSMANASPGSPGGLPSATLRPSKLPSTNFFGQPDGSPPAFLFSPKNKLFLNSGLTFDGPVSTSFPRKDTKLTPSSSADPSYFGTIASTPTSERALTLGVDPGEGPSTKAKPTGPLLLLNLPQELQDAIFEFAYTELDFKIVHKGRWELDQDHMRKATGKPKLEFPPHKVNEWMVSKSYFKAAAKAWVAAQTSLEAIESTEPETSTPCDLFPPMKSWQLFGSGTDAGLFLDFGRTFVVDLPSHFRRDDSERIMRCRKMRHLICIVHTDFFPETDRGFSWEVEFTDEELMELLELVSLTLPSNVETLQLRPAQYLSYASTEAKEAIFKANVANLHRVMWQHKSEGPHADTTSTDPDALYMGSKVTSGAPEMNRKTPPKQPVLFGKERSLFGKDRPLFGMDRSLFSGKW